MNSHKTIRQRVLQRDNYRCKYCRWKADTPEERTSLTLDHVIPKSKSGKTTVRNLVTACFDCNQKKADH